MRSILDQVAAGSLTPEQAAQLLGEQQPTPVERLLVKGSAVRLTIVADESVRTSADVAAAPFFWNSSYALTIFAARSAASVSRWRCSAADNGS